MDFQFTPQQEAFRTEIREFLEHELTSEFWASLSVDRGDDARISPEFSQKLGERGWIGLAWPKEYGGQELGYIERLIYEEEMTLAQAPIGYHHVAERQMGPSIIRFGTPEQKQELLPRIARGEMSICIGYSEENAGSDLAALECRADHRDDVFVLNGHKMWNSAHQTDWMWTAVRTDPEAPKHKGISVLLVDLSLPGIEITPTPLIDGSRKNIVRFHDTPVPKEYLVGQENEGWYVLAGNLDYERAGLEKVNHSRLLFDDLVEAAHVNSNEHGPLINNQFVRSELAKLSMEIEVGRLLCYRNAYQMSVGEVPNIGAAMSKCFNSELMQHVAHVGMQIFGMHATLGSGEPDRVMNGRLRKLWLSSIADTFAAGPGEIMRTVIATRGLGLPRS